MSKADVHVWFFSPDAAFAQVIARALGEGFEVRHSAQLGISAARESADWWDLLLLDLRAAENGDALEADLRHITEALPAKPLPPFIVMLGTSDHAMVLRAMENGAYDTVTSPPNMAELRLVIRRAHNHALAERELNELRAQEPSAGRLQDLVGASACMQQVFALAQKIAPCDVSVLITGETGTGKELLARAIHRLSPRAPAPFVAFSCASLPETLVEDELFGHERGAFTGALMARRGRFEVADRGTLFLDEVGDLGLALQAKLLRVLQARSFERLGSNTPLNVNIRLICATNKDLAEMVRQGSFREDLYYRLNVVQLHLPPLRERRDDVLFLAHHFLRVFAPQFGKKVARFSRLALHALEEYHWPGNVRELENIVQRAVVLAEGSTIEMTHLPAILRKGFEQPRSVHSYDEEVREFKRRLIMRALRECGWRKAETARTLGMARGYLHRLINQLQIMPEPSPPLAPQPPVELPTPLRRVM
jgi:DNA-binding NtrC family response regulator